MKKSRIVLFSILIFLILAFSGVFIYFKSQIAPVSTEKGNEVKIEVSLGTSVSTISQILLENNIIKNKKFFYYFARYPVLLKYFFPADYNSETVEIKSGIYYLDSSMNFAQIVNTLSSGRQEYIKISFPEGLTISKIGEILEENGICNKTDFKSKCYSTELIQKYNIPGDSLEGFLFPDTYFLNPGMNCEDIIDMMFKNFMEKISTIDSLNGKTFDDIYNVIKLASIVEREYRIPEEAPVIASVFSNRLKYNIGLYSCATVEYIVTEIQGRPHPDRILIEDTRIDNPYNTYLWAGLPPGPISNPGMIAINAAANPAKTKYYFFQIVDPEEGRHVFTSTFDEHKISHNLYTKK